MIPAVQQRTICTFSTLNQAIRALDFLALSGFPPDKIALVGKDVVQVADLHPTEAMRGLVRQAQDEVIPAEPVLTKGLFIGNLAGGMGGTLLGVGLLSLPGPGLLMLGSAIALTFFSGIVCTAVGGLLGTLVEIHGLEQQAKRESDRISEGNYLVVVNGTPAEIRCAQSMLNCIGDRR